MMVDFLRKCRLYLYARWLEHHLGGGVAAHRFLSSSHTEMLMKLRLTDQLCEALQHHEFILHYQPQFNLTTKKIHGIEALIRWKNPTLGMISPLHFISLAEDAGLMSSIGEWVLRTACAQNKKWQDDGLPPMRVAVNVLGCQFENQDIVKLISGILQETQLEAKYLELELTENIQLMNEDIIKKIVALKKMGVQFALDDFGTGYSSLGFLRKIPLDRIKIDQTYIKNIYLNVDDEVIIRAIIMMAKNLHIEVLAEGVETEKQIEFLKDQACHEVQGFYFSPPLTDIELPHFLRANAGLI